VRTPAGIALARHFAEMALAINIRTDAVIVDESHVVDTGTGAGADTDAVQSSLLMMGRVGTDLSSDSAP